MDQVEVVIVTGMSGAGKTSAMACFENLAFRCICLLYTSSYFIWYGIFRFFIEGLRTDSLYFMGLRTAQLVSLVFVVVGIFGYIYCKKYGKLVIKPVDNDI